MSAEYIDFAAIMAQHEGHAQVCSVTIVSVTRFSGHCDAYRLAQAASDLAETLRNAVGTRDAIIQYLAGKVARVEAVVGPELWFPHSGQEKWAELRDALADQPEQD